MHQPLPSEAKACLFKDSRNLGLEEPNDILWCGQYKHFKILISLRYAHLRACTKKKRHIKEVFSMQSPVIDSSWIHFTWDLKTGGLETVAQLSIVLWGLQLYSPSVSAKPVMKQCCVAYTSTSLYGDTRQLFGGLRPTNLVWMGGSNLKVLKPQSPYPITSPTNKLVQHPSFQVDFFGMVKPAQTLQLWFSDTKVFQNSLLNKNQIQTNCDLTTGLEGA